MRPEEIEKFLESKDPQVLGKIYSEAATSYDKVAFSVMIQALAIRKMEKLDKAATKLARVGIAVGIVGTVLALIQVIIAVIHK
jgi:hypothetical protein